ncbi:hypothetical protein BpHYR1_008828 [Brachionus plicatilis]|uniref:Uncharacterized protein n=1 Tax=Brachionus plicatilis TaxID=10195 RepID=A0A3M7R7N7_BRAPC|nr:hypothetical protein BpHYR1_008828 [Brachionus plicatilis]
MRRTRIVQVLVEALHTKDFELQCFTLNRRTDYIKLHQKLYVLGNSFCDYDIVQLSKLHQLSSYDHKLSLYSQEKEITMFLVEKKGFTLTTILPRSFFNLSMLSCRAPLDDGFTLIYWSEMAVI